MSNVAMFVAHEGCAHRCSFCNQHIIAGQNRRLSAAQVAQTLQQALASPRHGENQIAFFGGSFTAIERGYMKELLDATVPFREAFAGIRISTRPDAVNEKILAFLKPYGVTAIELGAQSMDDEVLSRNRRGHTAADVKRASALIRAQGFELGLQMMTGLYGSTDEKDIETAQELVALQPQTVRIYPTVVLAGTELDRLYRSGAYAPPGVESAVELCVKLMRIFDAAGVRILRVGLHDSEQLKTTHTAGAYHPAFKELCLSKLYLQNARAVLEGNPAGHYTLAVGSPYLSQMIGQSRQNLLLLAKEGYQIRVIPESDMRPFQVKIVNKEQD